MVSFKWSAEHPGRQSWHVPVGQSLLLLGTKGGWHITQRHPRKLQISPDSSKHLVFIQSLLPFRAAGYFSAKGNSCPINKGWWEGGREPGEAVSTDSGAFPGVPQLRAAQHGAEMGPGTGCAKELLGHGHTRGSPGLPSSPLHSWGCAGAVPAVPGAALGWQTCKTPRGTEGGQGAAGCCRCHIGSRALPPQQGQTQLRAHPAATITPCLLHTAESSQIKAL